MAENTYRAFEALEHCHQPFGNYATAIEQFEHLAACYPDVTLQRFSIGDTSSPWCRVTPLLVQTEWERSWWPEVPHG